jgi:hypothetical protein
MVPATRLALVERLGPQRYKLLFSLASALGLVLIVAGYAQSGPRMPLFERDCVPCWQTRFSARMTRESLSKRTRRVRRPKRARLRIP